MPLTQHEIVRRLGISRGTLHRVLTDSPLVKASTRERVLKELEKLHYTPNAIARGLKTRRTKSIGIVGPGAMKLSNIDKFNALHKAAQERGYPVTFGYSDGSVEDEEKCIRELRSRMVDGFIVLGRGLARSVRLYQSLIDSGIPLVTLYPIPGLTADCVYIDTEQAYIELTEHLIKLGHRDIGLLLQASTSQYIINREQGFCKAMAKAKLKVNEQWIIRASPDGSSEVNEISRANCSDYQLGFWGASLLFSRRGSLPTAVVCQSDDFAIGFLRAADLAGINVPNDIAIVGYDGKEPSKFARVPLTTMRAPDEQIGKEAVSLLLDRIEEVLVSEPLVRKLKAQLIVRESCGSRISAEAASAL